MDISKKELIITINDLAKICHEANRAYCEMLGDFSNKTWEETAENIRNSTISGVRKVVSGEITNPKDSHNYWLQFKIDEGGWKYGPIKDLENKIHPCFVTYDLLPEEQRVKDEIFFALCTRMKPFVELEKEDEKTSS